MKSLSHELLIEAYIKAIELKLDEDFQALLKQDILRRERELNNLINVKNKKANV